MVEKTEWDRIAARIRGLDSALSTLRSDRMFGPMVERQYIYPVVRGLVADIGGFLAAHEQALGPPARAALQSGLECLQRLIPQAHDTQSGVSPALVATLRALESEVAFHLHDFDAEAAPVAERAFLHLQRSLVVDEDIRAKWRRAFDSGGETACEKLGAAHLLLHGIYAFKTDAKGERSDLILGEQLAVDMRLRRAALALLLTEWKVARAADEVPGRFEEARRQADRYIAGHLAGFEIHRFRYLVVVSEDHSEELGDLIERDITYRRINLAISPSSPSRAK